MRVLIFACLAIVASATNYGYSSIPSYTSYSYSSDGIGSGIGGGSLGYGSLGGGSLGYGSLGGGSLGSGYGGGYGSGVTYVLGGAGHSYGSGSLGGHYATSYKPSVTYQTARYSAPNSYGAGAGHESGIPVITSLEGPAVVSYTQDIPVNAGQSDYLIDTPLEYKFDDFQGPTAPKSSGGYTKKVTTIYETGGQGGSVGVVPGTAGVKTITRDSGLHADQREVALSDIKQPAVPGTVVVERPVSWTVQGSRSAQKTGAHGLRTNEQPHISFVQDFPKVQERPGFAVSKPKIHRGPSGFHGGSGSIHRSGIQGVTGTGGQGQVTFTREITKTTGHSQQGIRPEIFTGGQIHAPVAGIVTSQDIHSFGVDSLRNTDVREQGGYDGVSWQSGHQTAGVKPGYVSGISKQTIRHTERVKPAYVAGISQQSGYHSAGIRPATVSTGRVSSLPRPASGYAQRADSVYRNRHQGVYGVGGPQISFTLGGASLIQPGSRFGSYDRVSAPRVSTAPRLPTGHSRVTGGAQRATGFSTGAAPGQISFTQDFSRVSGQQVSAVRPGIAGVNTVRTSAFPQTIVSSGYKPASRNTATYAPKPALRPVPDKRVFTAPTQPIVQQPAFTSIHDAAPIRGSITGSTNVGANKAIFTTGNSLEDSRAADDKNNVALIQDHSGNKFVDVTRYDDQKSALAFHSTGAAPAGNIVVQKESILQLSPGRSDSTGLSGHFGQTHHTSGALPFRNYYSSAYPGYSQVSGESPRYGFSHDRNLLYSYNSPYLVSPFSYSYTGGKEYVQRPIA